MPTRLAFTGPIACSLLPYQDVPLKSGEIRVRTAYATGKYGTNATAGDGQTVAGWKLPDDTRLFTQTTATASGPTPDNPHHTGTGGCGTVSEVGPGVTKWKIGDAIYGPMDIRQTNVCNADWVWAMDGLGYTDALAIDAAFVAFHCLREGNVRVGDTVAVVGLGPLGLAAIALAKSAGAERIIAVDPSPGRRALAMTMGADAAVDAKDGDAAKAVHDLTGGPGGHGPGVDVAIELSGVYAGLNTAIRATRVTGTVVAGGFYGGETKGIWFGREFHHNRLTMIVPHGCGWGHPARDNPRWDDQRAWSALGALARRGSPLGKIITQTVPLAESEGVFTAIRDNPDSAVKFAVDLRA